MATEVIEPRSPIHRPDVHAFPLAPDGIRRLREALDASGLPNDDLTLPGRMFLGFDVDGQRIGYGGLEGNGPDVLLRSVLVLAPWRGHSLGRAIVLRLEAEARRTCADRLHLLTTTAGRFFTQLGYELAGRTTAPSAIAATRQFASLCPASAAYLVKQLRQAAN